MPQASNYPPGVTGNEPQITGLPDTQPDLTPYVETLTQMAKTFGSHPLQVIDAWLEYLAEDEGGRRGVYSYTVRDADGNLIDYVIADHDDEVY